MERAATLIQRRFRRHLQDSPFPTMLDGFGRLKEIPALVPKGEGVFSFGARPLRITGQALGKGAYASVYAGSYNRRPVAVKIGRLPELEHLERLLQVQRDQGVDMIVPLPVSVNKGDEVRGIALMPRLHSNLKEYLLEHPGMKDRKRRDQFRISDQLVSCGVYHEDQTPENFLVDRSGKVSIADFGCVRVKGAQGEAVYAEGSAIEDILPASHPYVQKEPQRSAKGRGVGARALELLRFLSRPSRPPF
jgi:serine/threonine protein kinase